MNRTEPELIAVRELMAELAGTGAEPSAESVARTWSRITAAQRRSPGRVGARWLWLAVPVAAGVVVAAAVVGPFAVRDAPTPPAPVDIGRPVLPSDHPRSDKLPTPRPSNSPKPNVAVLDLGTIGAAVPFGSVINEMETRSAWVVPLKFGSGQLMYVRNDQVSGSAGPVGEVHQTWVDPDRMVAVKILIDGDDYGGGDRPTGPPDLRSPTPAWLNAMSTDPTKVYQQLLALNQGGKLSADRYVLNEWTEAMLMYGPLLRPPVRTAWYRTLNLIDGLTANQYTVGGKTYLAVGYRDSDPGPSPAPDRQLTTLKALLDPTTGQVVGEVYPGNLIELWSHAVVDRVGQTG